MQPYRYQGNELDLFAQALNWKEYLRRVIQPYLGADVLEVGAGLGGTTRVFRDGRQRTWTCLEPDPLLAERLQQALDSGASNGACRVVTGTLDALPRDPSFDAVLYIDVLEHIEDDRRELQLASERLRPGGALIVLSPAHQWLLSEFDRQVGHFRRYDASMYRRLTPPGTCLERLQYLDSAGTLLSAANRLLLRSPTPTLGQVRFWDRYIVPISRRLDPCLAWRVGKSVLGVWRRERA